ncbi:MAG: serine/threonine-protein kinase [Myxococcota bacterium]
MSGSLTGDTTQGTLVDDQLDPDREEGRAEGPKVIGRYQVLSTLGTGGMGTVFAAHDPELDRRVALKLLHASETSGGRADRARSRLQREARAIAQVKHENVIQVYDVGLVDLRGRGRDQVFVAMELVEGHSFRQWLHRLHATPEWSRGQATESIVEVMAQAARGLAAAHDSGLVHRDFKPDNALLGNDGVVRVVDFGLARRADQGDSSTGPVLAEPSVESETSHSGSLDERITKTGAMLGTPAYMAPEQFRRQPMDGRTDQFAFCLVLHEALYGTRAFPMGAAARAAAVVAGDRCELPDEPPVPAYLRAVIDRGLQVDPEARFPSMNALVEAMLDNPIVRRRKRIRWSLGGVLALGAAGALVSARPEAAAPQDACGHGRDRMETVWNAERRHAVEAALQVESLPYSTHVARATNVVLDRYAERWEAAHREACEATHVHHEQTGALLDRRNACLERRLSALGASIDLLTTVQPDQVEHALTVANGLPAIDACTSRSALEFSGPPAPDESTADAVAEVEAQMERASARQLLHREDEALQMLEALAPRVKAIGHAPLQADYLYEQGIALAETGKFEQGVEVLRSAMLEAQTLSMDPLFRDATSKMAMYIGHDLAKPEQALPWADLAEATDERIGSTDATKARLLSNRTWLLAAWDMKPEATEVAEQALAAAERAHDEDAYELINVHANLASAFGRLRAVDRAKPHFERALELTKQHFGPDHPKLIGHYINLGNVLTAMGELEAGARHLHNAARLTRNLPKVNPRERALVASALGNHALRSRDFEAALEHHRLALRLREELYGPEHPMVARTLNSLAGAARRLERNDEAIGYYERSLAIREKAMGPEHPDLLLVLDNLGVFMLELGRSADALPYLHRSHALVLEHGDIPPREAEHWFWYGRALVESGRDAETGMDAVREALSRYEKLDLPNKAKQANEWLAERGLEL